MDVCRLKHLSDKGKIMEGRKYPRAVKDVQKKLSFINKKISDLHHQRKFLYKNSVKVKKMVHNQVNQIVKCLRARERNLWSDIDESYISQDANISDELSRLQSIHAHCQALFNHLDDFRGDIDVLPKIYSILAEVNFSEKSDIKPLEFISDFEAMKTRTSNYGYLDGEFVKRDDFVLVADKKDNVLSDVIYKQFLDKKKCPDQITPSLVPSADVATSRNYCDKFPACKEINSEDSFQIIDLLDNMCCHDLDEDYIMAEEGSMMNCNGQSEKEFNGISVSENDNGFGIKVCNNAKYSYEVSESKDFNPDEEWKHISEMNMKIADFKEMFLKLHEEKQIKPKIHNAVDKHNNVDKLNKNCEQNRFLLVQDADNWLYNLSSKKIENFASPAEVIQNAFKPYLTKDKAKNWLSSN